MVLLVEADALGSVWADEVADPKQVKSGGELLFREHSGNAWLASPIQVYLDLLRSEGRAKDLAQHLRKERIGF